MLVVVYEGNPGDPLDQTMRLVRAASLEDARQNHPDSIMCQEFVMPKFQEPPNVSKLKRGMSVWSF